MSRFGIASLEVKFVRLARIWMPVSILIIVLMMVRFSVDTPPYSGALPQNTGQQMANWRQASIELDAENASTSDQPTCQNIDTVFSTSRVITKVFAQLNKEDIITMPLDEAEKNRLAKMSNVPVEIIDRRGCANGHNDFTGMENDIESQPLALDRNASTPYVVQNGCEYRLLLIVIFNSDVFFENAQFIRGLYKNAFSKVVFYSTSGNKANGIRKSPRLLMGYKQHIAISQAMMEYPEYDGYWWIGDDVLLNYPYLFSTMNFSKVWTTKREKVRGRVFPSPGQNFADDEWLHWNQWYAMPAVQHLYMCLRPKYIERMRAAFKCSHCVAYMGSDVGYIPSRFVEPFLELAFVFRNVMHEITLPTILRLMVPDLKKDVFEDYGQFLYIWQGNRFAQIRDFWDTETTFAHPIKFSKLVRGSRTFAEEKLAEASAKYREAMPLR